jgi:hypothetical protein
MLISDEIDSTFYYLYRDISNECKSYPSNINDISKYTNFTDRTKNNKKSNTTDLYDSKNYFSGNRNITYSTKSKKVSRKPK